MKNLINFIQESKIEEHAPGETGILTLSKEDMDTLHDNGEVSVNLNGATYIIKYQK